MLLVGIPIYMHAVIKLCGLIEAEEPNWLADRRSRSIFHAGMPSVVDPNVNLAIVWSAFSSRWDSLASPVATKYIWRIRILLPIISAVLVGVLVAVALGAP